MGRACPAATIGQWCSARARAASVTTIADNVGERKHGQYNPFESISLAPADALQLPQFPLADNVLAHKL